MTNVYEMGKARRVRIYDLPANVALMFSIESLFSSSQAILCVPQVPPGAEMLSTWYDQSRAVQSFLVQHESFDLVPQGQEAPRIWPQQRMLNLHEFVRGWAERHGYVLQKTEAA